MLVKLELWQWFLLGFCTNTTVQCGKSCVPYIICLLVLCDYLSFRFRLWCCAHLVRFAAK